MAEDWNEYSTPDGRKYYVNSVTGQSVWEMPPEVAEKKKKEEAESAAAKTLAGMGRGAESGSEGSVEWEEFSTSEGKPYYVNRKTRESVWALPAGAAVKKKIVLMRPPTSQSSSEKSRGGGRVGGGGESAAEKPTEKVTEGGETSLPSVSSTSTTSSSSSPSVVELSSMATISASSETTAESSTAAKMEAQSAAASGATAPKAAVVASSSVPDVKDDKERAEMFHSMLQDMKVSSSDSWDASISRLANDKRYGVIRTIRQRRALFLEYQEQAKKAEREAAALKARQAREDFMMMLRECKQITTITSYRAATLLLEKDGRFQALSLEESKRQLYEDFMHELDVKEREDRRQRQKRAEEGFVKLLEDNSSKISGRARWSEVSELLCDQPILKEIDRSAREELFDRFVRNVRKREAEQREAEKEEKRLREKKAREGFRSLLHILADAGKIHLRSRWKDVEGMCRECAEFTEAAEAVSVPLEKVFDESMEQLEDAYAKWKKDVRQLVGDVEITVDTSVEDLMKAAEEVLRKRAEKEKEKESQDGGETVEKSATPAAASSSSSSSASSSVKADGNGSSSSSQTMEGTSSKWIQRLVFHEMIGKAKEHRDRHRNHFKKFLKSMQEIRPDAKFEDWKDILSNHAAWAMLSEEERRPIFEKHVEKLRRRAESAKRPSADKEPGEVEVDSEEDDPRDSKRRKTRG